MPESLPPMPASAPASVSLSLPRRVFVRDFMVMCSSGVHPHEHEKPQRVCINLDLLVAGHPTTTGLIEDKLENVVCYETLIGHVRTMVQAEHVNLVETLAERIAQTCLEDPRVSEATVRVEKPDVFTDVGSVGVEIVRGR